MIFRLLTALFSAALLLSCHNGANNLTKSVEEVSIAQLKSLCRGDHYRIVENIAIRGVVVATDWLGEMNKSAIIIDKTGGLEFEIDLHNISEQLPVDTEVTIMCQGLMLARIGGTIKLGAPPTGDFPLDCIDDAMFSRYIRIIEFNKPMAPVVKKIEDLGAEDICTLVQFDNLRICDEERGLFWCNIVDGEAITTIRTFVDREGNTLAIRTLSTCEYAIEAIPTNEISVVGVLEYSDNRYLLRIVNNAIY